MLYFAQITSLYIQYGGVGFMQDIQKLGIHSTKPIDNDNFDDPEERYEWEPFDDVDPVDANSRFNGRTEDSDLEDTDLHILPSENGRFSAYADIRGGIGDNIWNRTDQSGIQNIGNYSGTPTSFG